jgi:hypothetical protein
VGGKGLIEHCNSNKAAIVYMIKSSIALILGAGLMAVTTTAYLSWPFPGYSILASKTPDIILLQCTKTPPIGPVLRNGVLTGGLDGLIEPECVVLQALKGDAKPGPCKVVSEYRPRIEEVFVAFGYWNASEGAYDATERYRIISLPPGYTTNELKGKSLSKQLEDIARIRLNVVKCELPLMQQEQSELQEFLK